MVNAGTCKHKEFVEFIFVSAPCMCKLYLGGWLICRCLWCIGYASVNSSCAFPPSQLTPRALEFFSWMANSREWGHFSCQMPRGGDEERGQMPCPQDDTSPSNTAAVFIHCTIVPLSTFKCVIFCFCRSTSPSSNWLIMQTTLHDS